MKKYIFMSVLVICLAMLITGCGYSKENLPENESSVKDTPVRIGKLGVAQASLADHYDLVKGFYASDLVVDITITSWIDEDIEDCVTFFDAKVNRTFKGDSFEKIVLLQMGSSQTTIKYDPLFKVGDRLLLFLREAVGLDEALGVDYENAYWNIGAWTTVMDIQAEDNMLYAMDRWGVLTEFVEADTYSKWGVELAPVDSMTKGKLRQQIERNDPILHQASVSRADRFHKNMFFYDDIAQVLEVLATKGADAT